MKVAKCAGKKQMRRQQMFERSADLSGTKMNSTGPSEVVLICSIIHCEAVDDLQ